MPKKQAEPKAKSFIEFPNDPETVIINGKRFVVNQHSPSFDLINKYSALLYGFQHIDTEIQRAYKVVDAYNNKLDEAKEVDEIIQLSELIEKKKAEAGNILPSLINAFYDIIEWLLGSEAVSIIKANTKDMESLIPIFSKIAIRNQHFNNANIKLDEVVKVSTK